jgi:putative peptide zinc metalloprotease protein
VTTLLSHAITSLLVINIMAVLTQAFIAQAFRASVGPLSIGLRFGFFPRFTVRIRHTDQLSRRERIWLHAGPLLMRVFLFSVGVLVWYNTRDSFATLSRAGLAIAFLCGVNILLEGGNPLVKGNGYHLLAAFMDEPHLRAKSYKAFMAKLRGGSAGEAESNVLATYALANFLYAFLVVAVIVMIVTKFVAHLQIGGTTIIVALVLGGYLLMRTVQRFAGSRRPTSARSSSTAGASAPCRPRAARPSRSRRRATGPRSTSAPRRSSACCCCCSCRTRTKAGGNFDIYPNDRQVITSDVSGIVEEVNFVGTESVKKGTVIARINATDLNPRSTS